MLARRARLAGIPLADHLLNHWGKAALARVTRALLPVKTVCRQDCPRHFSALSPRRPAAIHREVLSRDVGSRIAKQKRHGSGDLTGPPDATQR